MINPAVHGNAIYVLGPDWRRLSKMAVVCSNRLKVLLAAILHEREGHPADGEHDGRKQQAHPNPEGLPGFDLQVVGA